MTLALAQVRDLDCIATFSPLTFDEGSAEVSGAAAILRRILYRWCTPAGFLSWAEGLGLKRPILDLDASTWTPQQLRGYEAALEREAKDEDYVLTAKVRVTLAAGVLTIRATIKLVDGITYPLEVTVDQAATALRTIGAAA